jgi:hypothetical protein
MLQQCRRKDLLQLDVAVLGEEIDLRRRQFERNGQFFPDGRFDG